MQGLGRTKNVEDVEVENIVLKDFVIGPVLQQISKVLLVQYKLRLVNSQTKTLYSRLKLWRDFG